MTRDPFLLSGYIDRQKSVAQSCGISLSYHEDFHLFRRVASQLEGRQGVQPFFDTEKSETSERNGFWIQGTDGAGEIVHIQAMRLLDLGDKTLVDHMNTFRRLYIFEGFGIDPDTTEVHDSWLAKSVTGLCTYHGEIWVRRDYRKRNLGQHLPRLGVAVAQLKWQAGFSFGYVIPELALRGLPERYGYCHVNPRPFSFRNASGDVVRKVWLVVMRAEEFADIIWDEETEVQGPHVARALPHRPGGRGLGRSV